MPLTKQEGIVLKRRDFGETSRIAIIYTRDAGKIQVNAKGARKPRSKFGASLEPLTRLEIVYYHRDNKDLYTLSETSIITPNQKIRENPAVSIYGLAMAETLDALTQPEESDGALYRILGRGLLALEQGDLPELVLTHYLLHLSAAIGFKPGLANHCECGNELGRNRKPALFSLAAGTVYCEDCSPAVPNRTVIKSGTFILLNSLAKSNYRKIGEIASDNKSIGEALDFALTYLRYHTDLKLKSLNAVYNNPLP
ncbi:MAG: DNA repair protein RecO [bacterium]|nr:DNA repair protein RecO [bacterium]